MTTKVGVGVAITLSYGRIGVSGGSTGEPDIPANALIWRGSPLMWRGQILTWR